VLVLSALLQPARATAVASTNTRPGLRSIVLCSSC
jgi:hypothetical protein